MDEKRKIDVEIAGLRMSLVTDETESFVESVVRRVNDSMNALLQSSRNRTRLDASLLCALDFCSDKLTAEKRVRNLEAQISLYDVNLRKARAENAELRAALDAAKGGKPVSEQIKIAEPEEPAEKEEKKEEKTEEKNEEKTEEKAASAGSREDKFRMIESLLKGQGGKKD
ncbi:MAG: cell division protein ZapA [Clostridia bacterium]|nr:cell division protein ZapA [Clostridia bacterium]